MCVRNNYFRGGVLVNVWLVQTSGSMESEEDDSESESGVRTEERETLELEAEFFSLLVDGGNCALSNTSFMEGLVMGDTPVTGVETDE